MGVGMKAEEKEEEKEEEYVLPDLPEAPVFYPTMAEFQDPHRYIDSIREIGEKAGIIKIVPPKEWNSPFMIGKAPDDFQFQTCVQAVDQLRRRASPATKFLARLRAFHKLRSLNLPPETPVVDGRQVDLLALHKAVDSRGGMKSVDHAKKWGEIATEVKVGSKASSGGHTMTNGQRMREVFRAYLEKFGEALALGEKMDDEGEETFVKVRQRFSRMSAASGNAGEEGEDDAADTFGFGEGAFHTFGSFKKRADGFKDKWFGSWDRTVTDEDIEREYWRVVDGGDLMLRVEYGNDLDVQSHGSGFPTAANTPSDSPHASFVASPWNLNNLPLSDGSLLSYISPDGEISGVSAPWVYVGMLFASFCWHNEDNYLYSINYHHFGGGKTWYGVPGPSAHDFEKVFHEEVPELFEADPKLLFKLCTMITPKVLKARGIPVVHTIQRAGEFIITFPQAYHAGFSHGFNCNEAVNFALADWLPYGRASIERYKDKKRSPVFSHERLVCTIAHRNFRGGAHERITPWVEKEMRWVAATERAHREALMTTAEPAGRVRGYRVADGDNHVRSETEWIGGVAESDLPQCHRCLHYLYLSAVLDMRNPKRISCLEGACVSALVGTASEGGEMALGEHAQHLVLAYRFSMLEIYALIASSEAGELARARQIDTHFPALEQQSPALQVWFQRSEGAGTKGAKQKAAGSMRKGGQHASGRRAGARISQASAAGTKRPGQSSAAVPGKLYFGFCDEVIKAIKRLGGDAASDAGADKSTGGGGGAAGGGGLCKVEWDQTAGRPRVPVKVGHACSIEEVGEVQVRPAWVDEETGMYYPKGFRSTRVFPSMVLEGKCSYISSVEEGEAGQPVFCVECADEVGVRITAGSPADCWQQVMVRVTQLRAAKRLKPT